MLRWVLLRNNGVWGWFTPPLILQEVRSARRCLRRSRRDRCRLTRDRTIVDRLPLAPRVQAARFLLTIGLVDSKVSSSSSRRRCRRCRSGLQLHQLCKSRRAVPLAGRRDLRAARFTVIHHRAHSWDPHRPSAREPTPQSPSLRSVTVGWIRGRSIPNPCPMSWNRLVNRLLSNFNFINLERTTCGRHIRMLRRWVVRIDTLECFDRMGVRCANS